MKKNMNKKYYMITTVSGALLISMLTVNASQRSRERLTGARIGQMQRGFETLNLSQLRAYLAEATSVRSPNEALVRRLNARIGALKEEATQAELAQARREVERARREGAQEVQKVRGSGAAMAAADVAKVKQQLTRDLAAQQRNFESELAAVKSRNQRDVQAFRDQQAQLQASNQEMQQAIQEKQARASRLSQELSTARLQQGIGSDTEKQEATARVVRLTKEQADAQRALETAHKEQVARLEAEVVASRAANDLQIQMLADRKKELMDAQSRASKAEQLLSEAATAAQKAQAALKSQEATNALVLAQATASAAELQKQLVSQAKGVVADKLAITKQDKELATLRAQVAAQDGKLRTAMALQKGGQTSQEVSRLQTELQQKEALVTAKEQQLQQEREAALTKLAKADEKRQADQQQALADLTRQTERAEQAQAEVARLQALLAAGQVAPADVVQAVVVAQEKTVKAQGAAEALQLTITAGEDVNIVLQSAEDAAKDAAQNQVKQAEQDVVIAEKQLKATQALADANPAQEQLSMAVLSDEQRLAKVKDRLEKWKKRAQVTAAKKKEISAGYLADIQAQQEAESKAAQAEAARLANQNKSLAGSLVDAVVAAGETIIKGPMSQEKAALQEAAAAVRWTNAQWTDAINQAVADSGLQGEQRDKYTILITKLAFMSANEDLQKTGEQLNVGFLVWRAIEKKEQKALQALLQVLATSGLSSTDDAVSILRKFVKDNGGLVEAPRGYASRLKGTAIGAIELTGAGLASAAGATFAGQGLAEVVTPIIEASQELGVPAVAGVAAAGAVAAGAAKVIYSVGSWALSGNNNLPSEYIQAMAGKSEEECLVSQFKPLAQAMSLLEKTNNAISIFYAVPLMRTSSDAKNWRRSFRSLLTDLMDSNKKMAIFRAMLDKLGNSEVALAVTEFEKIGKSSGLVSDFTFQDYLGEDYKWQAIVWQFVLMGADVREELAREQEEKVATAQGPVAVPVSAQSEVVVQQGFAQAKANQRLIKVNFLIEPIFTLKAEDGEDVFTPVQKDNLRYLLEDLNNEERRDRFLILLKVLSPDAIFNSFQERIETIQRTLQGAKFMSMGAYRTFDLSGYLNQTHQDYVRDFLITNQDDPVVIALDAVESEKTPGLVAQSKVAPLAEARKFAEQAKKLFEAVEHTKAQKEVFHKAYGVIVRKKNPTSAELLQARQTIQGLLDQAPGVVSAVSGQEEEQTWIGGQNADGFYGGEEFEEAGLARTANKLANERLKKVNFLLEPIFDTKPGFDDQDVYTKLAKDNLRWLLQGLTQDARANRFLLVLGALSPSKAYANNEARVADVERILMGAGKGWGTGALFTFKDYSKEQYQNDIYTFLLARADEPEITALDAIDILSIERAAVPAAPQEVVAPVFSRRGQEALGKEYIPDMALANAQAAQGALEEVGLRFEGQDLTDVTDALLNIMSNHPNQNPKPNLSVISEGDATILRILKKILDNNQAQKQAGQAAFKRIRNEILKKQEEQRETIRATGKVASLESSQKKSRNLWQRMKGTFRKQRVA